MIITGDTYIGRTAARSSSEWHSAFGGASSERRRYQSYLTCVLGNDSALGFDLVDAEGQAGEGYDVIEVRQCLDLSAVAGTAKVRICLRSGPFNSSSGIPGISGYYPFGEYRFTLIRYGALRLGNRPRLSDLFELDCEILK